jgi:hypothetical protein
MRWRWSVDGSAVAVGVAMIVAFVEVLAVLVVAL